MTSTVLDVSLCLLLASASVVTLTTIPNVPGANDGPAGRAGPVAESLTTATASVNYSLAPGARRADERFVGFPVTSGPAFERSCHGTIAELLAEAAVDGTTIDGHRVTHTSDDFRERIRRTVANETDSRTQVIVVWRPFPGSKIGGRLAVGPSPPPSATVDAATVAVPSGFPATRSDAQAAARRDGFEGVARVVANRTVSGLLPAARLRVSLRGDYPVNRLARYRYRRVAVAYGVTVDEQTRRGRDHTKRADARIARAMTPSVERSLRARYDTPRAAARHVAIGRVRLVVRTWGRSS